MKKTKQLPLIVMKSAFFECFLFNEKFQNMLKMLSLTFGIKITNREYRIFDCFYKFESKICTLKMTFIFKHNDLQLMLFIEKFNQYWSFEHDIFAHRATEYSTQTESKKKKKIETPIIYWSLK